MFLSAKKCEQLQDFLSKLFEPPLDLRLPLIPIPRIENLLQLHKQYALVRDTAERSGYVDRARSGSWLAVWWITKSNLFLIKSSSKSCLPWWRNRGHPQKTSSKTCRLSRTYITCCLGDEGKHEKYTQKVFWLLKACDVDFCF